MRRKREQGYILIYTVIAITVFAVLATQLTQSTFRELNIVDRELTALLANGAVDAALECILYWNDNPDTIYAFNTNTAAYDVTCESRTSSVTFTTSDEDYGGSTCNDKTYNAFTLELSNGSCAHAVVSVEQLEGGYACKTIVDIEGLDDCDNPSTFRTRKGDL